jgi:predicted enzyme related to lactoylglutathione lyase
MAADWARPVVHWELIALDPVRQADFYRQMFNWEICEGPIMQIGPGLGGPEPGPAGHIRQGDTSAVSLFVQVGDLRATVDRVPGLGGKVTVEPFDLPDGPTVAFIEDPEGNPLALVQQ